MVNKPHHGDTQCLVLCLLLFGGGPPNAALVPHHLSKNKRHAVTYKKEAGTNLRENSVIIKSDHEVHSKHFLELHMQQTIT